VAVTCPKCRSENPEDTSYCGKCGTPLRGHVPDSPESDASPPNSQDARPDVTETIKTSVRELTTGSTFAGRYQVIEELGRGGMGRVYKVLDTKIGEKIALKLIGPSPARIGDQAGRSPPATNAGKPTPSTPGRLISAIRGRSSISEA
jgi:hypothetical protein